MRLTDAYKTRTYEHGDYIVQIISKRGYHEAWLRHKDFGIAVFVYGFTMDLSDFLKLVKDALPEEIKRSEEEVMGGELDA